MTINFIITERIEKAMQDRSKLTPKKITDKNGHRRTVYVRMTLNVDKDGNLAKESWDNSTERAKSLKVEDFGAPEIVEETAKPVRFAWDRRAAVDILKEIIKATPVLTSKSGTRARISSKSAGKLVSSDAVKASFDEKAHFLAVANLDRLFLNAIEPWKFELNPNKNNQGLKERKYLYAPLVYDGRVITVKFTVKSFQNDDLMDKIYSIEAINVSLK
jgi:hypothetical protein